MRTAIAGLMVCMCAVAPGQQAPRPKKVLTPEQIAYQAQLKDYYAQRDRLLATAVTAYKAEQDREKTGVCPNAMTTVDINQCLSREISITEANYGAYTAALRAILALPRPNEPSSDETGPTEHVATSSENAAAFDAAELAWRSYATAQCKAVDTLWHGGTIVGAMFGSCRLRMTRDRLHELDDAYDMILHP